LIFFFLSFHFKWLIIFLEKADRSLVLAKQALSLNQKSHKSSRFSVGDLVISQVSRSSSSSSADANEERVIFSRVVKVEKSSVHVAIDPYQLVSLKGISHSL
jgi:hypothetical protein